MRNLPLCFLSLLALATGTSAGEIVVPDDYPDLVTAIENAQPNDLISVRTSAWQFAPNSFSILVDKPITIAGDPICRIAMSATNGLELAGPGFGAVTLINVHIGYDPPDSNGSESLYGGGFDELHLFDCTIDQTITPSGLVTQTYAGIDVDIPLITILGSSVEGTTTRNDSCPGGTSVPTFHYPNPGPGIRAPDATVLVVDSEIRGGSALDACCVACLCPADITTWKGIGADAVIAREVYAARSVFEGGVGAQWMTDPDGSGTQIVACEPLPSGVAFNVSGAVQLTNAKDLVASGPILHIGQSWELEWSPSAAALRTPSAAQIDGVLFGALDSLRAPRTTRFGLLLLDPSQATRIASLSTGGASATVSLPVPVTPSLVGRVAAAQALTFGGVWSTPVAGTLLP